jgi:hypothetical protein
MQRVLDVAGSSGIYLRAPLPGGYDVHLYSHVLHDWDEARVVRLLVASFAALPPSGWLLDHDARLDAPWRPAGPQTHGKRDVGTIQQFAGFGHARQT